jgi:hypothetical protein
MNSFLVKVACLVHIHSACPIPNGYQVEVKLKNKTECEHEAKKYVTGIAGQLGLAAADFHIECLEK